MKRTIIFGLVSIILTFFLVTYNNILHKQLVLNESQVKITSLLNSVEMDLKRAFFGLDQLFLGLENYLSSYAEQGLTDPPRIRRVIDDLILKNDYLTALTVADADGQILYWNNNNQKPNIGHREYFKVHKSEQHEGLYIGLPQKSIINKGQWIFGISKALRKADGSLDKILTAIIDTKYFSRQYHDFFVLPETSLTISSPEGVIYSRIPDHNKFVGLTEPLSEESLRPTAANQEFFHRTINGQIQLTSIRKLDDYPMIISIGIAESTVYAPWRESSLHFSMVGGLFCLALLFLTYRTALSQKKEMVIRAELQRQAITDPLTELANRRYVLEQSQLEIKKAQRNNLPLSLIMIDLDHFKKINDTHGHQAGDEILKNFAQVLKAECRESDNISRFGGEEFLLLLPATDLEGAISNAEKIRLAIEQHLFKTAAGEVQITASFGVTQLGSSEADTEGALRRADKALYQAKRSGRNAVKWLSSSSKDEVLNNIIWFDKRVK